LITISSRAPLHLLHQHAHRDAVERQPLRAAVFERGLAAARRAAARDGGRQVFARDAEQRLVNSGERFSRTVFADAR
jgi:hypothetical protein